MESLEQYQVERIAQALGDAQCIRIVELLARHEQWMDQAHIATRLLLDETTLALHLKQLYDCGLLESISGRYHPQYRLSRAVLDQYIAYLERFA